MFEIDSYLTVLKSTIEKCNDELIENLKKIKTYNFYSKIDLLDFCLFKQPFELSISLFSMDKEANEVFYEGNNLNVFSGSLSLIQDIEYFSIPENEHNEFLNFYEKNFKIIEKKEMEVVVNWFVSCWEIANGEEINLPSYFSFQDSLEVFDLKKNTWISDNERWEI